MIAFLTKSDASEGFDQIVDFLNAYMIQYALMVNPTIYVSCIKQFWTSALIKKSNDVVRLQALINRKKVIITDDTIRQALRLDDVDGVDCLPNEEIFAELERMRYDKPMVRNMDSPSMFLMYLRFLQLMINAQVDDLSTHNTKYTSLALTQKVFANMRRVGMGLLGVDTPLFYGMLVQQQVQVVEDAAEDEDDDNEVSTEPTPPSPTPTTLSPSPTQEHIPSPPQAQTAQPSSPPPPPQPLQTTDILMTLLNTLRLEKKRHFKSSRLKRLRKVGIAQRVESLVDTIMDDQEDTSKQGGGIAKLDADEDVTFMDAEVEEDTSKQGGIAKLDADEDVTFMDAEVEVDADVQGRLAESQEKVYHLNLEHAEKVLSMQDTDDAEPDEVEEVIEVVTAAKLMTEVVTTTATTITVAQVPKASAPRRRRGVAIQDPKETATASVIVHSEVKSKDKGTALQFESSLLGKSKRRGHMSKRKGSKRKDNSLEQRAAKKQRIDEETEELKTHLQIRANDDDDVYTEATSLALKVSIVDYQIHHEHNKPYYKIIRADGTHQLFLSFITLLQNFDREDLEILWKLVQQRFQSLESKIFSDDFLLNTLKIMFKKPNVEASIWRDQRDDSTSGKETPFDKIHSGTNVEQWITAAGLRLNAAGSS
nr:hypothetical protein [Tanacetum cinerariifolium]